jgi:hypothetical protein
MNRALPPALAAAFAGVLAASTFAQAPIVTTVLSNGTTQTRYDMVILAEGYQAFEQSLFNTHVQTFLTALFQHEPYQTFAAYYNVHTVFRASVDSGADHPDETPPIYRDTVYNATYDYGGTDRCLYIQNTSQALADAALAPANEGRVLVLVNDTRYGGCASTFAVSYTGSQMTEVQTHELGHSLGQLADEYDYPYQTYTGSEPGQPNLTTSSVGQKWNLWWGTDGISAFQGAGYYLYGLYRPKTNCLMRTLGVVLCRVCQESISKLTNASAHSIVATLPSSQNVIVDVPNLQPFSFAHIVPAGNGPTFAWKLDGNVIPSATTTAYTLDSSTLSLGVHTLECSVHDHTVLVRNDPQLVMREAFSWQVMVADPNSAQLRVPSVSTSAIYVQPGGNVSITATIANDGPAAAGPFAVEYFLSPTTTWTPQSMYLGGTTVPNLAATQQTTLVYTPQLPWSLPLGVVYGFVVVDRLDAVHETIETDNVRNFVLIGQAGPCVTKLEFDDALTYPRSDATLSLAAGGVVHPTVFAPCANTAATLYLIAWTASGTSPGVTLAPGVTLPLNPDAYTTLGLDALNGPVFGSFLGLLDAQHLGHATFTLPPAVGLATGPTNFACVLLGNPQLFTAASNAIALTLAP